MSLAGFSPAKLSVFAASKVRRMAAWFAASASDRAGGVRLVIWFAMAHALLWTVILAKLKAAQDIHFDTAEAYRLGTEIPARLRQAPAAVGMGRRAVVRSVPGDQSCRLRARDGDRRLSGW